MMEFTYDYTQIILVGLICIAVVFPNICCLACILERLKVDDVEVVEIDSDDLTQSSPAGTEFTDRSFSTFEEALKSDSVAEEPKVGPRPHKFSLGQFSLAFSKMTHARLKNKRDQFSAIGSSRSTTTERSDIFSTT